MLCSSGVGAIDLIGNLEPYEHRTYGKYEALLYASGRISRHKKSGKRVIFVQFPTTSPEHRKFCLEILGVSVARYVAVRNHCERLGACTPSIVVESYDEMFTTIMKTAGAIGYYENYKIEHETLGIVSITVLN